MSQPPELRSEEVVLSGMESSPEACAQLQRHMVVMPQAGHLPNDTLQGSTGRVGVHPPVGLTHIMSAAAGLRKVCRVWQVSLGIMCAALALSVWKQWDTLQRC